MIPKKVSKSATERAREVAKKQRQKDLLSLEKRLRKKAKTDSNTKAFLKTLLAVPKSSEQINRYFLDDQANKNSKKKFSEREGNRREAVNRDLRSSKEFDKNQAWGVSFNASLKQLNVAFRQDLAKTISKRFRGKKLKVASIGCGTGLAESQLQQALGNKIELHATGLTVLPDQWTKHKNYKSINWHVTHAEKMSRVLGKNSMDVVFSNLGFHHAGSNPFLGLNLRRAFRELETILAPGGLAIINTEGVFNSADVPRGLEVVSSKVYESGFVYAPTARKLNYHHRILILKKK